MHELRAADCPCAKTLKYYITQTEKVKHFLKNKVFFSIDFSSEMLYHIVESKNLRRCRRTADRNGSGPCPQRRREPAPEGSE